MIALTFLMLINSLKSDDKNLAYRSIQSELLFVSNSSNSNFYSFDSALFITNLNC